MSERPRRELDFAERELVGAPITEERLAPGLVRTQTGALHYDETARIPDSWLLVAAALDRIPSPEEWQRCWQRGTKIREIDRDQKVLGYAVCNPTTGEIERKDFEVLWTLPNGHVVVREPTP